MADRLTVGNYDVAVHCPRCALEVIAIIDLQPVLTVPAGEPATVKIKVRTKPVEHRCGQGELFEP